MRLAKICSSASRSLSTSGRSPMSMLAPASDGPMGDCLGDAVEQRVHVDAVRGSNWRRPSRESLRTALISRSMLRDRGLDEADGLVEILAELLDRPRPSARRPAHRARRSRRRACDLLEDVLAQRLELGGEAHDVDERRAQIVADDVGEALDLLVGLGQVGGAVFDDALEIGVGAVELLRAASRCARCAGTSTIERACR